MYNFFEFKSFLNTCHNVATSLSQINNFPITQKTKKKEDMMGLLSYTLCGIYFCSIISIEEERKRHVSDPIFCSKPSNFK